MVDGSLARRTALAISLGGVVAYSVVLISELWGTSELVGIHPDTTTYLRPAAAAFFEGKWDHLLRPFGYPALAYIVIKLGGSLNALVTFQLVGYFFAGCLIYLVVLISLGYANRGLHEANTAPLFATAAMLAYFVSCTRPLEFAYYVIPESICSTTAVAALTMCATLICNRLHPPTKAVALAIAASACSAFLISLKPSMAGVAILTLVLAGWGFIRQNCRASGWFVTITLTTMVAIPSAVVLVDDWLIRKYADEYAKEFGPLTAFCNNAPLVVSSLERSSTNGRRLLGENGARDVAQFLRNVIAGPGSGWPLLGFDGDRCVWVLEQQRKELERKYFGIKPEQVAGTYRQLVISSIIENPADYLVRISKQISAYIATDKISCNRPSLSDWSEYQMSLYVKRLISFYAMGPTSDHALPVAPGTNTLCLRLNPFLSLLGPLLILLAVALATIQLMRARRQHVDSAQQRAVLSSAGFWLSGAIIVALVHTFDIGRYVIVMFPVYIATLAIALGYLMGTARRIFVGFFLGRDYVVASRPYSSSGVLYQR
jgi:hypothetical protein